jgi:hypothetical protein
VAKGASPDRKFNNPRRIEKILKRFKSAVQSFGKKYGGTKGRPVPYRQNGPDQGLLMIRQGQAHFKPNEDTLNKRTVSGGTL